MRIELPIRDGAAGHWPLRLDDGGDLEQSEDGSRKVERFDRDGGMSL